MVLGQYVKGSSGAKAASGQTSVNIAVVSVRCSGCPVFLLKGYLGISVSGRDKAGYVPSNTNYLEKYAQILFLSKGPICFYKYLRSFKQNNDLNISDASNKKICRWIDIHLHAYDALHISPPYIYRACICIVCIFTIVAIVKSDSC